jgi:hypothetical protein
MKFQKGKGEAEASLPKKYDTKIGSVALASPKNETAIKCKGEAEASLPLCFKTL